MDSSYTILILIFLVCIFLSAIFSGSEVAFFSLKDDQISKLRKGKNSRDRLIVDLLDNAESLLTTILLGNTIVNVSASIIAAVLTLDLITYYELPKAAAFIIEVIVITFILLVLSEITPKVFAANRHVRFSKSVAPFIYIIYLILSPLTFLVNKLAGVFKFRVNHHTSFSGDDLKTIATVVHEQGNIEDNEREMINSIVEFKDLAVKDVMVARLDIMAVPTDISYDDFMEFIKTEGHSRIPLYDESLDHIVGIIYVKDMIPFLTNRSKSNTFDARKISRQPLFVPEGKPLDDLLKEFQAKKTHIAVVVDEYGGTAGIVTMEDVIEQIIGDIQDEYDEESPLFKKLGNDTYLFDGKIPIEDAEQILNIKLEFADEKFETLAGFILAYSGTIPKEKAVYKKDNIQFIIEQMDMRRIAKIKTMPV